jgi:hypothetical protein
VHVAERPRCSPGVARVFVTAVGKTADEASDLGGKFRQLEDAGASSNPPPGPGPIVVNAPVDWLTHADWALSMA